MKKKIFYWAIFRGTEIVYENSFNNVWKEFVKRYANSTVSGLHKKNVRIGRIN